MTTSCKIISVKQVKGFIHPNSIYGGDPNRYNGSRLISRSYDPIALFVEGYIDGVKRSFYTPTVIVSVCKGFLNTKSVPKNSWFNSSDGPSVGHKGLPMFDGGTTPNVAIEKITTITPAISAGDIININFVEVDGKMKRVKLISIE